MYRLFIELTFFCCFVLLTPLFRDEGTWRGLIPAPITFTHREIVAVRILVSCLPLLNCFLQIVEILGISVYL